MKYRFLLLILSLYSLSAFAQKLSNEKGVSLALAKQRKQQVSDIHYQLYFNLPADKTQPIKAQENIFLSLNNTNELSLDFKEVSDHLVEIKVNGKPTPARFENEHILLDPAFLLKGSNTISIQFIAGDLSLNRNNDYLYTLLVPDRARTLFPCFDQPDLKARFTVTLSLPSDWEAVTNGALQQVKIDSTKKIFQFKESDIIPTYLFSFSAGRFSRVAKTVERPMQFLHRETDSIKLRLSIDSIFQQHAAAIAFLEDYTQIKYPFQKFDFIGIPDFQYGGMEHVGAIDYKASTLFLDSGATRDQLNARSNLLAHETSHMWFGDLVTMQWFNDVWMKEVFANFMADKITQGSGNNYELKFLLTHYPRAYAIDRTAGANPIRQQLTNMQEAGTLYGPIIYDKAPVMMRQLERLMGKDAFRDGLRAYLKKYSFSNATWPDLIKILDERTPVDLQHWNQVWVNTPGRPVISYSLQQQQNRITQFSLSQKSEQQSAYLLPQFFELAFVYGDRIEEHTVNMNAQQVILKELAGKAVPDYILFNSSGQGYGLFPVDLKLITHISELKDPVMRGSAYISLYENMLSGRLITPKQLLDIYTGLLIKEEEELNLSLISGHIADIYWRLITPSERNSLSASLENDLWKAMQELTTPNKKKILFRTYQNIALTSTALDSLYNMWKQKNPPTGIRLNEEEYTSLALNLALKEYKDTTILSAQLARITNPDRRVRLEFLMPALSPDQKIRDQFFASLKDQKIRKKESWVGDALGYLHHPLRASTSISYLLPSLQMLEEIQLTGDIFFPSAWLSGTLGSYQNKQAADIVRSFLKAHPSYNPKLKAKILQAADPLFRAEKLVHP